MADLGMYILCDGLPVQCHDVIEWGAWMETNRGTQRIVARTTAGDVTVSTVFLGLDHGFSFVRGGDGPPIVWETMIFGGLLDQYQDRYATREQAIEGHARAVALAGLEP